jgi:hypothetical protein
MGFVMVSSSGFTDQQRQAICSVMFGAYMTGCTDSYRNKGLNDRDIEIVVNQCRDRGIDFTKTIDICKDMIFEK